MRSKHKDRMREIKSVAIPPQGTHARELLEKFITKSETPEKRKYIKKFWKKAQAIVAAQQLNGAGNEADQAIRWFHGEYNYRIWSHDLHSLPSTFNVVEAFLKYIPQLNAFSMHQEENHLFSFSEFVDSYTSESFDLDHGAALEAFAEGVIYFYDNLNDPSDLLYGIERNSEIGISGFAMIRFGSEISILCVAGETEDLIAKTEEIKENLNESKYTDCRKGIKPDPSLSTEAVPLKSERQLWRLIALSRFDLDEMTQSVRYICHDNGTSYSIKTDDPSTFFDMKGDFPNKSVEAVARNSAKEVSEYNALFDLCSTAIFLPLYFESHNESIVIERYKTRYASEVNKTSFLAIKNNIPRSLRIAYRNVNVLKLNDTCSDITTTIYSIPNFHIETSGFWRTLSPGKMGTDKKGNPVHGRTWVSKKITWMEADEPNVLIARKDETKKVPEGSAPGFVYVMRAPIQAPGVFKVGLTQKSTETRANELSKATGVPGKIYVVHEWAVGDCVSIEREVHHRLSEFRVDPRREFFDAPLKHIVAVIEETINSMIKES